MSPIHDPRPIGRFQSRIDEPTRRFDQRHAPTDQGAAEIVDLTPIQEVNEVLTPPSASSHRSKSEPRAQFGATGARYRPCVIDVLDAQLPGTARAAIDIANMLQTDNRGAMDAQKFRTRR